MLISALVVSCSPIAVLHAILSKAVRTINPEIKRIDPTFIEFVNNKFQEGCKLRK